MFAAPIESSLKDTMEFGEAGFFEHEQSPPHQRTDAAEHYAKRGQSAQIPKTFDRSQWAILKIQACETPYPSPHALSLSLTPGNLPLF